MPETRRTDNLNLQYLYAELQRIDALIQREVRRWQLAGQNPANNFRGLYISDDQAAALSERAIGTSWGQTVRLPVEEAQAYQEAVQAAEERTQVIVQKAERQGRLLRLRNLAALFSLDRFAVDTLLICLAPHLDLRYESIYGYLQDDVTRTHPTVNLILDLLCQPGTSRLQHLPHFFEEAPLFHYRMLQHGPISAQHPHSLLSQRLDIDPSIVVWLLGAQQAPRELQGNLSLAAGAKPEDRLLVPQMPEIYEEQDSIPLAIYYGPDTLVQDAAARLSAAELGYPLLTLNLDTVSKESISLLMALRLTLREAQLNNALPYIKGWDRCLKDGHPPPDLLAELYAYSGSIIISGKARWQARGVIRDRPLLWMKFPLPDYGRRTVLWKHFTGDLLSAKSDSMETLAGQFTLTTGQIRDAVATARDQAAQRKDHLQIADLLAAARAHSNPRLRDLAHKITPRYSWDDIILPADRLEMLREIVIAVRERYKVLDIWGVGQKLTASRGVTMLFAGPPGTGKTMAAEVIATELSLDLYRIDLSTIISKYIGETEKNLEQIFNEAQSSNAILFFDEADAIFGKRSQVKNAHDRYANIETSYLLQRMESYDGVTILATNLRANLDVAFTRRLQFAIDFPFPEEQYRQRIWKTLFPPEVPRAPELDFGLLARRFKLTGGNIRNIIVAAAYLAAAEGDRVTMAHLLHATRRELQKIGRLVNETDLRLPGE